MWILPPITSMLQPVAFGGARLKLAAAYRKTYYSRRNLSLEADISYGFRNRDVNGTISLERKYNPFKNGKYRFKAGRNFEFIYPGDAWVNVLKRSNIYLNNSFELGHELEIVNGLTLMNDFEIALRRSVSNLIRIMLLITRFVCILLRECGMRENTGKKYFSAPGGPLFMCCGKKDSKDYSKVKLILITSNSVYSRI